MRLLNIVDKIIVDQMSFISCQLVQNIFHTKVNLTIINFI